MSDHENRPEKPVLNVKVPVNGEAPVYKYGFGKFHISIEIVEEEPEVVPQVMERCVVTRCEFMFYRKEFEYHAYSPDFERCVGSYGVIEAHEYLWVITRDLETGTRTLEAKRADRI